MRRRERPVFLEHLRPATVHIDFGYRSHHCVGARRLGVEKGVEEGVEEGNVGLGHRRGGGDDRSHSSSS